MPRMLPICLPFLFAVLLLTGCCPEPDPPQPVTIRRQVQSLTQLHTQPPALAEEPVIAAWLPYFTVDALLAAPDPSAAAADYLKALRDLGINTVFVHVCAFGESVYPSAYYPALPITKTLNAMQLFPEICRELGISFHAWINPLRLQTAEYMEAQKGDSVLHAWYTDPELRAERLSEWDGRFYLNPAAESTADFLTGAVTELISQYHPDGIHIDDYFYPTAQTAFDMKDFEASGAADLAEWRRSNITRLLQRIYTAAHAADPDVIFSVSPQGSLSENRDTVFADIPAWLSGDPCCDWIIPQIYFGYENEHAPFEETLLEWLMLPRREDIRMIIGLAAYKAGQPDPYAGVGAEEWRSIPELPVQQAADVLGSRNTDGAAFYHADALLNLPQDTAEALRGVLKRE